jgi:hypothetical protein
MTVESPQIDIKWTITDLERKTSDGYVYRAFWKIIATYENTETGIHGSVEFPRTADFIPFEDLTEDIIVSWTKNQLGPRSVNSLEETVVHELELKISPITFSTGLPWATPVDEETPVIEETVEETVEETP